MKQIRPTSRPLVIEFFGMPGGGKTTIAKIVLGQLQAHDRHVVNSRDLTRDSWSRAARTRARLAMIAQECPRLAGLMTELLPILGWPQATLKDRIKSLYVCLTVAALLSRIARRTHSAVLDQGPAQAIWSAMLMSPHPGETDKILHKMRRLLPDHDWQVVFIDAPDEVLRQRLSHRAEKHSRLQSADISSDPEIWTRARGNLTHLINHFPRSQAGNPRDLISIKTADLPPHQSARLILDQLAHATADAPPPCQDTASQAPSPIGGNPQVKTPERAKRLRSYPSSSKNKTQS